jgi:flagellar protein FliO/FliZ
MDVIRPDQYVIMILFLGVLGVLWLWVRMNKSGLGARLNHGKRISVSEVTAVSPADRAMIIKVDGQEFFIFKSKGVAPVVTQLQTHEGGE